MYTYAYTHHFNDHFPDETGCSWLPHWFSSSPSVPRTDGKAEQMQTKYSLSQHRSSGEDLLGDCIPSGSRTSPMTCPPLTLGYWRQEIQLRVLPKAAGFIQCNTVHTYSGACWYWTGSLGIGLVPNLCITSKQVKPSTTSLMQSHQVFLGCLYPSTLSSGSPGKWSSKWSVVSSETQCELSQCSKWINHK